MLNFVKKNWSLILILVLGLVPLTWYQSGFIVARGDSFPYINSQERILEDVFTWKSADGGAFWPNARYLVWSGLHFILSRIGLSDSLVQLFFFLLYFLGAGLSMYFLALIVFEKREIFAFLASVFYMFNFTVVRRFFDIHYGSCWLAVVLPLLLAFYIRIVSDLKSRDHVRCGNIFLFLLVSTVLFSFSSSNPSLVVLSVLALFFVFLYFFLFWGAPLRWDLIKTSLGLGTLTIAVNFWWIVNYVSDLGVVSGDVPSLGFTTNVEAYVGAHKRASFLNILRLNSGWVWGEEFMLWASVYATPLLLVVVFVPVFVAFSGLLFKNKHGKINFYLSLISLGLVFLIKGLHPPFRAVNTLFYKFVPGFIVFRYPGHFYDILVIFLALLVGSSCGLLFEFLMKRLRDTKNYFKLSGVALISIVVIFLISAFPLITGGVIVGETEYLPFSSYIRIPEYWYAVGDYLGEKVEDFKVLATPKDDFYQMPYKWGYYGAGNLPTRFIPKPTLQHDYGYLINPNYNQLVDGLYAELGGTGGGPGFLRLASLLNSRFILQRNDIWWNFRGRRIIPPQTIKEFLADRDGVNLEESFGELDLYRIDDHYFLPHFYVPQEVIYLSGDVGGLVDIVSFDDWESRSAVYIENVKEKPVLEPARRSPEGEGGERRGLSGYSDILRQADEVFVVGERSEAVEEILNPEWEEGWAWPEASVAPWSWKSRLVKVKEWWAERKARRPLEKVDVLLWHACKRMAEIEKFAGERTGLSVYLEKMNRAVEILKAVPEGERGEDYWGMVRKVLAYTDKAEGGITKNPSARLPSTRLRAGGAGADEELIKRIKSLHEGFKQWAKEAAKLGCESGYCYELDVPEEGSYEVFVGKDTDNTDGGRITLMDGGTVLEPAEKQEERNWVSFGKAEFSQGRHRLELSLPEPPDLVEEGDLTGELSFSDEIESWRGGERYEISFDYRIGGQPGGRGEDGKDDGTRLNLALFEKRPDWERAERPVLSERTGLSSRVLLRESLKNTSGKWGHFKKVVRSHFDAEAASIYLYTSVDEELGTVEFKNIEVRKVLEPKVLLCKTTDSAGEGSQEKSSALKSPELGSKISSAPSSESRSLGNSGFGEPASPAGRSASGKSGMPKITFIRVNPTKYRVRVEGAEGPYALVFSESYHEGWKIYAKERPRRAGSGTGPSGPDDYGKIVASYFDGDIREGVHRNTFLDRSTFETWGKKPIAEDEHRLVNGYANSWYIRPEDVGGVEDYELIVEFTPQRLFYIGLFISGLTLLGCLGYLGCCLLRKF